MASTQGSHSRSHTASITPATSRTAAASRAVALGLGAAALGLGAAALNLTGCGAEEPLAPAACAFEAGFEAGAEGHPDPLGAGPGEARAGRIRADQLPPVASGLPVWAGGDYALANDKIAIVIEDVDHSDLYDPWGGRLVGVARVDGGALVEPADFGEFFLLTGRDTVVTRRVSVIADGSDGGPAIVRAQGRLGPLPFTEAILGPLLPESFTDIEAAIDYVLEPGAEHVDVFITYHSTREREAEVPFLLHAYMYTNRMVTYAPGVGFDTDAKPVDYMAFIDDDATSYAYVSPEGPMRAGLSVAGFVSNFGDRFDIAACGETRRHHVQLVVGGPGVDGLNQAVARARDTPAGGLRAITGTVREADGAPAAGVRVHAETADGAYVTRVETDAEGAFALHVGAGDAVELTAVRRGDELAAVSVPAGETSAEIALDPTGIIDVTAIDADTGEPLPVRVQVLPVGRELAELPRSFGEPAITGGRLHVVFPTDGRATLRAPVGQWRVVVSRGYEYELIDEIVTVDAGQVAPLVAPLPRVVDTAGVQCADFHIHTHRSNDSPDDARVKLASGVADGLELPVRTEHEFVSGFQPLIEEMGLEAFAFGVPSIELTSMLVWGHMGVVPLEPDPAQPNNGAPLWQRFPSADEPDIPVETLLPSEVFAAVRARPEQPVIIINHPRGNTNFFEVAGYDRATGLPERPELWDEEFTLVEVFNSRDWLRERDDLVLDWLSLLDHGRRVFAVGSSDSHRISSTPLGYPRTCLRLGTDDPREVTPDLLRDTLAAGHSTISGGVYLDASVGDAGPGDDVVGAAPVTPVRVRVQAASWVDVDFIDVVVDGQTVETIAILPDDADPQNPAVRFDAEIPVDVLPGLGSYVVFAAYGDGRLEPVHPGEVPFAVSNPIFLSQ